MSDEPKNVVALISNLVLLGTSVWGLKECIERPFISAGFALFAVRGLVGAISHFDGDSGNFKKAQDHIYQFVDHFGFPLLAVDIMGSCIRQDLKIYHLFVPAVSFIHTEMKESSTQPIKEISHAVTAGGVLICAQQTAHLATGVFTAPYLADIAIRGMTETNDYHELLLALGTLFALLFVKKVY